MAVKEHPLLQVNDLVCEFAVRAEPGSWRRARLRAVDGVSLTVGHGETLAVVGESGCGKSTMARAVAQLISPVSGTVEFGGRDITRLGRSALRRLRRDLQYVFQDASAALDPRMRIGASIAEPLRIQGLAGRSAARDKAAELLELVGLPAEFAERRPHELSGGQRQRVGLARALALEPRLMILDEPVSALDVSVQAQIINLLRDLRARSGYSLILIVHDLALASAFADRIAVMYLGRIVETGTRAEIFTRPVHPYTQALIASAPTLVPRRGRPVRAALRADLPSPLAPLSGCRFRTRCPRARDVCTETAPLLQVHGGTLAACHFPDVPAEETR